MKISSGNIPPNIARLMAGADKKQFGRGAITFDEAQEKLAAREEKELQRQIAALLRLHDIEADFSAMHKKTTRKVGEPDFKFAVRRPDGSVVAVAMEVKRPGGKLRPEQEAMREKLTASPNGWTFCVVFSVADAVAFLRSVKVIHE